MASKSGAESAKKRRRLPATEISDETQNGRAGDSADGGQGALQEPLATASCSNGGAGWCMSYCTKPANSILAGVAAARLFPDRNRFAQALPHILRIVPDFIHEAGHGVERALAAGLPGPHAADGNAQELGENRLAGAEQLARGLDLLAVVFARLQVQVRDLEVDLLLPFQGSGEGLFSFGVDRRWNRSFHAISWA